MLKFTNAYLKFGLFQNIFTSDFYTGWEFTLDQVLLLVEHDTESFQDLYISRNLGNSEQNRRQKK
jgi:hypothetical protein